MSTVAEIRPQPSEMRDIGAALHYLAAANESERESLLSDHEQYGLAVILRWIAAKIEAE